MKLRITRAAFISLLLFMCAGSALSIPLHVYHERVQQAITSINSIQNSFQSEKRNLRLERETESVAVDDVRSALPSTETIEWKGSTLRVDNSWLKDELDAYERLSYENPMRAESLARIAERLHAIDERLSEIEGRPGRTVDKDEEKARLAAILRRDEYNKQAAEGNALTRLMKRIREWLRNIFPRRESSGPQQENRTVNSTAQVVVSLFSLAVIAYIAWRVLPRFLRRERKKRKPGKRGARVVLGEQLGADESSTDLLMEAEQLARAGDLRGAIRKGYIALLCELHDRKLVRLEQHKTNRDYLRAVQSNRPLYEEMKPMTMSFENHWYGFIPATETDWQSFRAHYRKAVSNQPSAISSQ